jgi:hypothetical protein
LDRSSLAGTDHGSARRGGRGWYHGGLVGALVGYGMPEIEAKR